MRKRRVAEFITANEVKLQPPSSKHRRSSKSQAPSKTSTRERRRASGLSVAHIHVGAWSLAFPWNLELGIWNFTPTPPSALRAIAQYPPYPAPANRRAAVP